MLSLHITMDRRPSNRRFFFFILAVTLIGFFIFSSASLGLLNRDGANYSRIVLNQLLILAVSLAAMIAVSHFDYRHLLRLALPLFIIALAVSLLVFVPSLGFASGGAQRLISIGSRTFQPSELLKLALIIYLAAWFSRTKVQSGNWQYGLLAFFLSVGVTGVTLIAEPDLGTFFILIAAAMVIFFVAGGPWRHLFIILFLTLTVFGSVIAVKPYARERFLTFLNPTENLLTSSYQINQSLIAIGSGGLWGRGFGRSIQKFHYLPEPIGDSIFAVAGEEFGLIGGLFIIGILVAFAVWGLSLARRTTDRFGRV